MFEQKFMISVSRDYIAGKATIDVCHLGELDYVARVVCRNNETTIAQNVQKLTRRLRITHALKVQS